MTRRWCPAVLRPEGKACTRQPGHERLIDADGQSWDHGWREHFFNDPASTANPSTENTPELRTKRNPYSWAKGEEVTLARELAVDMLDAAESWLQHVERVSGFDAVLGKEIDQLKAILSAS
jgi:hypothetical protein